MTAVLFSVLHELVRVPTESGLPCCQSDGEGRDSGRRNGFVENVFPVLIFSAAGMGKTVEAISLILLTRQLAQADSAAAASSSSSNSNSNSSNSSSGSDDSSMDTSSDSNAAGTGKTAALFANTANAKHRKGPRQTTLVLCPMSLISQWRDEFARFCDLTVLVYYGAERKSGRAGADCEPDYWMLGCDLGDPIAFCC
jgi:hypothetical protein